MINKETQPYHTHVHQIIEKIQIKIRFNKIKPKQEFLYARSKVSCFPSRSSSPLKVFVAHCSGVTYSIAVFGF